MQSDDLKLEELVQFSQGRLDLHGRRLILQSLDAFAQFRRDLVETVGREQARRILTRYGYFWGQADAAAMTRILDWDSVEEWMRAGPRMLTLQGMATATVQRLDLDAETGRLDMEVVWRGSGEADQQLAEQGRVEEPACWVLVGYSSGYSSFCMGENVYFMEQECRAAGDAVCSAVGRDTDSWGEDIEPYLHYFEAEDIQGKVLELTEELKRKTRELSRQRQRLDRLEQGAEAPFAEVRSKSFKKVLDVANRVAPYDSSVLITGESGVGKEVLARHIHHLSPRSEKPFVPVNCGALPETLLESELFGHTEGAFTGASSDRRGMFEEAEGGTILLDEIAEIPPDLQVKLLRTLQNREIRRVGESRSRPVDVRVMAATNRKPSEAIDDGRFREDLYYRLAVIEIRVPPLRERPEDILPLARHFVEQFSEKLELPDLTLHATALEYLQAHHWPGNVRELRNAIERAAVMCRDSIIRAEDLPRRVVRGEQEEGDTQPTLRSLDEVEWEHIQRVLRYTGGNKSRAADILGISSSTLWRRLNRDNNE